MTPGHLISTYPSHPALSFPLRAPPIRLCLNGSYKRPGQHQQRAFQAADAKVVSSAENCLFAQVEKFPTRTLKLIISSPSTSLMRPTSNAACTLLFAPRTEYSNATTTPNWPDNLSTQGSDKDWRGRPSPKRGSRSLGFKNRRDSSGGASSSRGIRRHDRSRA